MKEVSKDDFYKAMGSQNVHPQIQGRWPYTCLFKTPFGSVMGKTVDFVPGGRTHGLTATLYYLPV